MSAEARAKELFLDALEQEPTARGPFVRAAALGDEALVARVEALFRAHEAAERRLARGPAVALAPGLRFGPFRLVEPLGEGGFGAVWRARQEAPLRRDVALKILRGSSEGGEGLARFEVERQTLATLTHPHIANVHDGGTAHGRPWFALELVDGLEITAHAERAGLGLEARLELFEQVCAALQHAHQRGVIHRDIKPSNVLVALVDGAPLVKVIDFGIALVVGATDWTRHTSTGQMLGTPVAMSPEQLAGARDVDTRADLYALGVLLYELLVGVPPFEHAWLRERGPSEALRILREEDPARPSLRAALRGDAVRARDLRGELDWIVMRCLEKDRERRYASVAELLGDLARRRRGEPVLAGPPGRLYRARKFARRHALALAALCVSVSALALGAGFALREARNARLAEDAASRAAEAARVESGRYQAIATFLADVLRSIDPAIAQGADTTVLAGMLARAEEGLAEGERPPEVEATLRRALGNAQAAIGDHAAAAAQLARALELTRAVRGEDAAETIELASEHVSALVAGGRLAEAEGPLETWLARARRELGESDRRTLALVSLRATLLGGLGRASEGFEALAELEATRTRELGPDHEETLLVTNNLAMALLEAGRLEESGARLERLMRVQLETLGEKHPRTLAALGNYAYWLGRSRRFDEAEELFVRVLELKLEVFAPGHPSVIVSRNNLAQLVEDAGRPEEALALFDESLLEVEPGTDHEARLLVNKSDCLRTLGREAEALTVLHAARASAVSSGGEGGELTRAIDGRLADLSRASGALEESERAARRALDAWLTVDDAPPRELAEARLRHGLALAGLGRREEARAALQAGLAESSVHTSLSGPARSALARLAGE